MPFTAPCSRTPSTHILLRKWETEVAQSLKTTSCAIFINVNVNKNPTDATVCRRLFTAKLLYMFRVSQHPSSGVSKTVPAASRTGHTVKCKDELIVPLLPSNVVWSGLVVRVEWSSPDQTTLEGSSGTSSSSLHFTVWPVREAAGTVFNTPVDGCCDTWNM